MRLVLPTPSSPTRQILNLKVFESGSIVGLRSMVGRDTQPGGYQAVGPIFRIGNAPARILRYPRSSPSARPPALASPAPTTPPGPASAPPGSDERSHRESLPKSR